MSMLKKYVDVSMAHIVRMECAVDINALSSLGIKNGPVANKTVSAVARVYCCLLVANAESSMMLSKAS